MASKNAKNAAPPIAYSVPITLAQTAPAAFASILQITTAIRPAIHIILKLQNWMYSSASHATPKIALIAPIIFALNAIPLFSLMSPIITAQQPAILAISTSRKGLKINANLAQRQTALCALEEEAVASALKGCF